jgi:hypothetical protein
MNSGTYTNRSPRFTRLAFLTIPSPIIRRVLSQLYHATPQLDRFPLLRGLGFASGMQAHQLRQTESSSSSYGLVVRLLLLPTPPCGDAVALGYGPESVCPEGTFTPLTIAPFGRTSPNLPVGGLLGAAAPFSVGRIESTPTCPVGEFVFVFTQPRERWVFDAQVYYTTLRVACACAGASAYPPRERCDPDVLA